MSKEGVQTHLMAKGASSVIKRHERVSASPSPLFSVRKIQNLFRLSHAWCSHGAFLAGGSLAIRFVEIVRSESQGFRLSFTAYHLYAIFLLFSLFILIGLSWGLSCSSVGSEQSRHKGGVAGSVRLFHDYINKQGCTLGARGRIKLYGCAAFLASMREHLTASWRSSQSTVGCMYCKYSKAKCLARFSIFQ